MKRTIVFLFCVFGLFSCIERQYEGDERYVVQGTFVKDGKPLQHELVVIDAYDINSNVDTSEKPLDNNLNDPTYRYTVVNETYTDEHGAFKVSFPGGYYKYVIKLDKYSKFILNGKFVRATRVIDLGTTDIAKKE
ncbi:MULTISPECIES: hypothetical protein [unclassified Myroides]|uniref:hypothetical protein n=1 Tax=unclassified Myroides TaxID=2642485 RepID=UPI0015FB6CD4|nr:MULTISPECIES: hypothetical protein [unclassified Myroides]MBB1150757.1 hypothetical protein [Myroides sp. NP-2]MDM1407589.1 hypothetical protein [Myroides sp. DF42-4-2]